MKNNILIIDEDKNCRNKISSILKTAGYSVTSTSSIASALYSIIKKTSQIVVLGSNSIEMNAADIVPLMKQCDPKIPIILIAPNANLGLLKKLRSEGIFYQAMNPINNEDKEEICLAVQCAFKNLNLA